MTMVAQKKISDKIRETHLKILKQAGEDGLCNQAIAACLLNQTKRKNPELEALDLSDAFLALHRRTGDNEFLMICRALRRAAHKVFWELSKSKKRKSSSRFLTLC